MIAQTLLHEIGLKRRRKEKSIHFVEIQNGIFSTQTPRYFVKCLFKLSLNEQYPFWSHTRKSRGQNSILWISVGWEIRAWFVCYCSESRVLLSVFKIKKEKTRKINIAFKIFFYTYEILNYSFSFWQLKFSVFSCKETEERKYSKLGNELNSYLILKILNLINVKFGCKVSNFLM